MKSPVTIFSGLSDFRSYAEGFTADTTYEQLHPSIRSITATIVATIGEGVYDEIRAVEGVSDGEDASGLEALKLAVATGAAYGYAIFAAVKKNGSEASLYKYQFEEIKAHHIEAHWKAMDTLLDWLDLHSDAWRSSEDYGRRQEMPVKNAREFNEIYGIGNSSFFFSKITHFLRDIWSYKVRKLVSDTGDARQMDLARHILVYRTMAQAVMMFDTAELPRSIRWDYSHEYAKDSGVADRDKLSRILLSQAETWEEALAGIVSAASGTAIRDNCNRESNKFYVML